MDRLLRPRTRKRDKGGDTSLRRTRGPRALESSSSSRSGSFGTAEDGGISADGTTGGALQRASSLPSASDRRVAAAESTSAQPASALHPSGAPALAATDSKNASEHSPMADPHNMRTDVSENFKRAFQELASENEGLRKQVSARGVQDETTETLRKKNDELSKALEESEAQHTKERLRADAALKTVASLQGDVQNLRGSLDTKTKEVASLKANMSSSDKKSVNELMSQQKAAEASMLRKSRELESLKKDLKSEQDKSNGLQNRLVGLEKKATKSAEKEKLAKDELEKMKVVWNRERNAIQLKLDQSLETVTARDQELRTLNARIGDAKKSGEGAEAKVVAAEKEIGIKNGELTQLRLRLTKYESDLRESEKVSNGLRAEVSELQAKQSTLAVEKETAERRVEMTKQETDFNSGRIAKLETEHQKLTAELDTSRTSLREAEFALQKTKSENDTDKERLRQLSTEIERLRRADSKLNSAELELVRLKTVVDQNVVNSKRLESERNEAQQRLRNMERSHAEEKMQFMAERTSFAEKKLDLGEERKAVDKERDELLAKVKRSEEEIVQLSKDVELAKEEAAGLLRDMGDKERQLKSEKEQLEKQVAKLEKALENAEASRETEKLNLGEKHKEADMERDALAKKVNEDEEEIEQLKKDVEAANEQALTLAKEMADTQQIADEAQSRATENEDELARLSEEMQQLEWNLNEESVRADNAEATVASLREQGRSIYSRIEEFGEEAEARVLAAENELESRMEELTELQTRMSEYEEELNEANRVSDELRSEMAEVNMKQATLVVEKETAERRLEMAKQEMEFNSSRIAKFEAEHEKLTSELDSMKSSLRDADFALQRSQSESVADKDRLRQLQTDVERLRAAESKLNSSELELVRLKAVSEQNVASIARLELERNEAHQRLRDTERSHAEEKMHLMAERTSFAETARKAQYDLGVRQEEIDLMRSAVSSNASGRHGSDLSSVKNHIGIGVSAVLGGAGVFVLKALTKAKARD